MTTRRWRWRLLGVIVVIGAAAAACGGADANTLSRAEDHLADAESGDLGLELAGVAADGTRTGFGMIGRYSFESPGPYPLLDLQQTEFAGAEARTTAVTSTGDAVWVSDGAVSSPVPDQALAALRLEEGDATAGISDLGIAGWVRNPAEHERSGRTVVTGEVDVADLLTDLARTSGQVAGVQALEAPDTDAAARLQDLVSRSRIAVVTRHDELRRLDAVVDFRADASAELERALGPYAGVRLEVSVRYRPLAERLVVLPPQ